MGQRKKARPATRGPFSPGTTVFKARDYFDNQGTLQIDRVIHHPEDFKDHARRTREFWRISHVISGDGEAHLGEARVALKPRSTFLVHPDDPTTYRIDSPTLTLINIVFLPEYFKDLQAELTVHFPLFSFLKGKPLAFMDRPAFHFPRMPDPLVPRLVDDLLSEFHNRQVFREFFLKTRMTELMLRMGRLALARYQKLKASRLADEIDQLIARHHARDLTLEDFADTLGMDKSYLGRVYRSSRGATIFEALHTWRLERATDLLCRTDLPISEVAHRVGYSDPRYFSRKFKLHKGTNPADFRRERQNPQI